MRIWSLHPKHLDAKGLVALWRETLLARHVLEGKTKGYKNHPQLERFKKLEAPLGAIHQYLAVVFDEASSRGYNFDGSKFEADLQSEKLTVTRGQFNYEIKRLQLKLQQRDLDKYAANHIANHYEVHPLFTIIEGDIESWEILSDKR